MSVELLSVVVVHYNIPREFPRTLYSLSPAFQQGIDADEYEVIVVDNGSTEPPSLEEARSLGLDVRLITMDDPHPSPVRAINAGLNASCGTHICVMIDGARMASPGLLHTTRQALEVQERTVVGSRGRYLGPGKQRETMHAGYTREAEDELLASIDWQHNGYDLFDISVFDESSEPHWFRPVSESNSITMSRQLWGELGGFSELFDEPGGGYVNLDTWRRACTLPDVTSVLLLGEATFHQLHGGVATNAPKSEPARMRAEYAVLRGETYSVPPVRLHFWGTMPERPRVEELGLLSKERKAIARIEQKKLADAGTTTDELARAGTTTKKPPKPVAFRVRARRFVKGPLRRKRKYAVHRVKLVILAVPGVRRVNDARRGR